MDARHLEILERIATGELDREDPAVVELCRESEEFRARLAEQSELLAVLEAEGGEEREVLALAAEDDSAAPGEDRIPTLVLESLVVEPGGRRRSVWVRTVLVAAAVVALLVLQWSRGTDEGGETLLGPPGVELLEPVGEVERVAAFRWDYDLPPGGWFQLTLRFDDGTSFKTSSRIMRAEWKPEPDLGERLSAGFAWEVTGFGPTGSVVARGGPARVDASY